MRASTARWDVIGIGANSVDHVYRVPAYPEPGSRNAKIPITGHSISSGGQMATALCTCAAMGLRTKYIGVTGSDENGNRIRQELARRGVDITDAVIRNGSNPSAVIIVDDVSGDRIVLWERDSSHDLRPGELSPEVVTEARVLHVDDVDQDAAIAAARIARTAGIPVTSDIDRLNHLTEELIAAVSIPILAAHLPTELTGESDLERALRKLRTRHDGLLCTTLGPQGAMLLHEDRLYREPAFSINAVDTTAAGDVFRAGFIYGLLQGWAVPELLRFANAAAAISCTRPGAIASVPSLQEVDTLYHREHGENTKRRL